MLAVLSLGGAGCEQSQPAPPALPVLAAPLPGPPKSLLLPERIDEKLVFIDSDGRPVSEIVCRTKATLRYSYRLPPEWTEAPGRAMCNAQTSQLSFQLVIIQKGRPVISGYGKGVPVKAATGEYVLTTTIKVPPTPGTGEYFLRARVHQTGNGPYPLPLCEIPIRVIEAPDSPSDVPLKPE
ncbi:MAG: hypothetical protein DWH91_09735 [Planctomycetota bacterium]|nr:MAG: hypothetical protein DWH91_09735 [Planctomycetota bacterium]